MKSKNLGKVITSATGLRRMANALQRRYKTKGDVEVEAYISYYPDDKKQVLGIILK